MVLGSENQLFALLHKHEQPWRHKRQPLSPGSTTPACPPRKPSLRTYAGMLSRGSWLNLPSSRASVLTDATESPGQQHQQHRAGEHRNKQKGPAHPEKCRQKGHASGRGMEAAQLLAQRCNHLAAER